MSATVALLGCSHPHSSLHLNSLLVSDRVGEIRFWDEDPAAARSLAHAAGERAGTATSDLRHALKGAEFALVCRRNDAAPDTVIAAAMAGKHILCEKPGATHSRALAPAVEAAAGAGVALAYCYPWRCHPVARELQGMAARGVFGRLMAVEARLVTSQVRFRDPTHWLFTRDRGGGGILHWLGCHFLDLLRYVLQDEVREVAAMTATLNGFPIEVEDTAALVLRWESGAVGTFAAGYHLPRSVAGYSGATYDNLIAARGEAGRFEWRPTRDREILTVESIHPDWATAPERELRFDLEPSQAYGGAYGLEFLHRFLDDARSGRPQLAGAGDALAVLQIIEAAYRSAQTGRAQPVQYD